MKLKDILNDEREIVAIYPADGSLGWTIEEPYHQALHVDKIEAYGEPGEYCALPWFALWEDGQIIARINAMAVSDVHYRINTESKNKPAEGKDDE